MAIPVHLQQFKAAGIYRVVFDKSTVLNQDTQVMRLVVGYSEQGPFNIPVLVKDQGEFKALFGEPSKKLEKRGIYFHRLANQMLTTSPIICLNLKKFDGETVSGSTVSTEFNPKFDAIDEVKLNVEDIYDTTRFWELQADRLNNLRSASGTMLDQYINLAITNTKNSSVTYFIRKASGNKVAGYNITVNDWYSDEEMPEYLQGHEGNLMSDFMAEIYVFKGKFTAKQVLASETLKNYFIVSNEVDENDEQIMYLRDKIFDAFGDPIDTLDALYSDSTSNALGHWVGSLIPYFKDKQGAYMALDIAFNNDIDVHNMMMSFNVDQLEEENIANIDLSGRLAISVDPKERLTIDKLYEGTATTTVLGNSKAPVVVDEIDFVPSVVNMLEEDGKKFTVSAIDLVASNAKITGQLYVSNVDTENGTITIKPIGDKIKVVNENNEVVYEDNESGIVITFTSKSADATEGDSLESMLGEYDEVAKDKLYTFATKLGVVFETDAEGNKVPVNYMGTYSGDEYAFSYDNNDGNVLEGPQRVITSILRLESVTFMGTDDSTKYIVYTDIDENVKVNTTEVLLNTVEDYKTPGGDQSVYGSSLSFIKYDTTSWEFTTEKTINGVPNAPALVSYNLYDNSLIAVLSEGDFLLANDGVVDYDGNGELDDADGYFDNIFVQDVGTMYKEDGSFDYHYVLVTAEPYAYKGANDGYARFVRIDGALNKEIGIMRPTYMEGYTYKNDRPLGQGMYAKVKWQEFILSALTDYKGLRTGLLNKSEIDYRYVIDTFESFPVSGLKNVLSFLCKEKQSAFCISNFPSVQTFVKCPYTSFTDSNGVFNVQYVVNGFNKKKAASIKFSLPSDSEGASFIAFYSPLKFSDGFVDTCVPSAGLVSNLFIEKYRSRQPYYIIAGPSYGSISASGLVGPDYRYSVDELQIIEPFGVNIMVYRPGFGTFINANQTAKQTPVSALSKVHVRELVIYLQDEIEKVLQAYQWEFNNQVTRNAILDKANTICALVAANGGLQAYQNIMDESNNTPEIIDNEMAVISTHIEPGMGCGKMVQELTLYRTGQMSASIS